MKTQTNGPWYLTQPKAISKYLASVIRNWGYPVTWNPSDDSESSYIQVYIGTPESPKVLYIRISDHSIPPKNLWVFFDVDVYCSYERENATSYMKIISNLAGVLDRQVPEVLNHVKTGTEPYKRYRLIMQKRKKTANGRSRWHTEERLYV
jgi:hypothetical protein